MLRTPLAVLPASLLLSIAIATAQHPKPTTHNPEPDHTPASTGVPSGRSLPAGVATTLPVTRVSLYKNGVGFFEHTGHISGNAAVTIDFTSGQLNDVLQSLTAIDLNGGRISGADYNSTTPLEQQLKNLPLPLGETPTSLDFYNAIRGSRVSITGSGPAITGRLLSVEERTIPSKSDTENQPTKTFLTVVSELGETRTLELTPTTSVHLLDTALHTDVTRYLQLLDANRSQGLRHLTLTDLAPANGTGSRELRLSYISEVPIWKSTYRILFSTNPKSPNTPGAPFTSQSHRDVGGVTDAQSTATLQGWSVVDNTTGADWINVQLSLIAGAPQSFIQPLSQPIYSRRPEIPIAQEAQLSPQTFDSSIDMVKEDAAPSPAQMMAGIAAPKMPMKARSLHGNAVPGAAFGGIGRASETVVVGASDETLSYQSAAEVSLNPTTKTSGFDDFFSYTLTEPVTILKNQSALVPILQAKVAAEPVTIVRYQTPWSTTQPLRAMWLTNTSGLTLDRGSFSILEDGNFAGEGLLDPIHPGEKRLLSYAADQAVHVTSEDIPSTRRITRISAAKGVLHIQHALSEAQTYTIHNSAAEPRTVVIEYPVNSMFTLDPSTPTPTETTPTVYRFRLTVAPGATATLPVSKHGEQTSTWQLINSNDAQFANIFNDGNHDPALIAALQPILDARRRVADAQAAVDATNKRLTDLRSDEDRQRANITALSNADKDSRNRFVHDLNATEDNIAAAQKELATRTAALDASKADVSTHIEAFQIDTH